MENVLNNNHPNYRLLDEEEKGALNVLHFLMSRLKADYSSQVKVSPDLKQDYRDACEIIELAMQELWGFDQDPSYHTHVRYFS